MPAVARKSGVDEVASPDGTPGSDCEDNKKKCDAPSTQKTDEGSDNVFIMGIGVVREGDAMIPHPSPACGCGAHAPTLDIFSTRVYANGKRIGRVGDSYAGHTISTGASTVIDGSAQYVPPPP